MLELQQLDVGYPGRICVQDVSLQIPAGHLVVVLGANGVGKTTLLRTLAGLHAPRAGRVQIAGREMDALAARERAQMLGLALAEDVSGFAGTVRELIQLGRLPYRGALARISAEEHVWTERAAAALHIQAWLDNPLRVLSSGMLQRVQLARLWVQQTPLMLLDEPLAHLDWPARYFVMQWLAQMAQCENRTVIMSAHEVGLGLQYADSALVLSDHGRWYWGAPELLGSQGHLDALYGSQGLRYDAQAHDLRPVLEPQRALRVPDDDPAARWLIHLAQRSGWRVAESADELLLSDAGGYALVSADGHHQRAASWHALRDMLRRAAHT